MRAYSSLMDTMVRRGLQPGSAEAYGFALACVLAATLLRLMIDMAAPDAVPFATFFPALLIAALVGGLAAGVFATVLGGVVSWWAFMEPRFVWTLAAKDHFISVGLYLLAGALIVWTAQQYRLVLRRVDEEEKYRKIVVDELGHRVKNKLATIYAILRHELRGHPEVWDSVSGRLQALSAADDFVVRSDGDGVDLRHILEMELEPYGDGRVSIEGAPVRLYSKMPTVLALLFHELATNAAKYGALSTPRGKVTVAWQQGAGGIELTWTETGGPPVHAPARRSFGSNLIERSLDSFGGFASIEFAPAGVICRMRLPDSEVRFTSATRPSEPRV